MSTIAAKIRTGKSTTQGKPVVKSGPSQTAKITTAKPGKLGKGGGC